jgi:predicted RNA-binding protein with PIN domain
MNRASGGVEDVDLLLIDGDNLLHAVRGSRDEGGVAWLLPRLSSWRPLHLRIVVGLDGHAAPGEASRTRATRGIEFHHSGRRQADDMLIDLLEAQPYAQRSRTIVVTRDRTLQARAVKAGGASRSVDWLMGLVASGPRSRVAGPKPKLVGIGQGRPPRQRHFDPPGPQVEPGAVWEPGRGATRKKGNPKRSPKGSRGR